jgi:hypothetical protein
MKNPMKNLILIVIILSICSCHATDEKKDKQNTPKQPAGAHSQVDHTLNHQSLAELSLNELSAINRNISIRMRENFRSWKYKEPDRWPYLADKFIDEVVNSVPVASADRQKIAEVYLSYLKKRAVIINSNEKNKKALMGRAGIEFKYNLSAVIGIEGYQKWKSASKNQIMSYNQMKDSLNAVIAFASKKRHEQYKK